MSENTSNMPVEVVGEERHVYSVGADRARKAYRRKRGAAGVLSLAERRAWNAEHAAPLAAAAMRGGLSAVRKMHTARVHEAAEMCDASRIGGGASGVYRERIQAAAVHSSERLAALADVGKAPRKAPARKAAKGKNSEIAPVELESAPEKILAPETVPAPMPAMSRAARKATRREIAATMRAAGVKPEGQAWRDACAAAGLVSVPSETVDA